MKNDLNNDLKNKLFYNEFKNRFVFKKEQVFQIIWFFYLYEWKEFYMKRLIFQNEL